MKKRLQLLKKIFTVVSGVSLVFNSVLPVGVLPLLFAQPVFAQEATASSGQTSPTPTDTTTPSPTDTATPTPTIAPTDTATPSPTETSTPTATSDATPSPTGDILDGVSTESATPTESLTPTDTATPSPTETQAVGDNSSSTPTPAPQSTATPTPTVTPAPTPEAQGSLNAAILHNTNAQTLNLDAQNVLGSATLTTNKPDYSPTDTVVVTGTNFLPKHDYTLEISSPDPPPVDFTTTVTTDPQGTFIYAYQLDGNYRPNYTVNVKDGSTIIATTTFLDGPGDLPSSVQLSQWETLPSGSWTTGNLGSSNSDYKEGETVPFQLDVSSATAGTYTLSICRDYQDGTHFGYLSLMPYNTSRSAAAGGTITSTSGAFSGVNVTINSVNEVGGQGACKAKQRETDVSISVGSTSPEYLLWGGHLASPLDAGVGAGNGASSYPGSSLSMALNSPNKNRSINPGAIIALAQITVNKIVDSGGASASSWCFNISPDPNSQSGTVCGPTGTFLGLPTGSYTITESSVTGYAFASGSGTNCTFNGSTATASVTAATTPTNATCTFHNAQQQGTIKIVKNTVGGNNTFNYTSTGGNGLPGSFSITTSLGTGSQTYAGLPVGSYTVTEGALVGWNLTGLSCQSQNSGSTTSTNGSTATITLGSNDTVTCTYTNTIKNSPTISTKLSNTSITVGNSVNDSATLTGATGNAGGTVTYSVYTDSSCSQNKQDGGTEPVTSGSVPNSNSITFNTPGDYYWQAVYSGDANNNGASSSCTSEHLVVNKATPVLTTTASGPVTVSSTITDTAHLSGGFGILGGNITFDVFAPGDTSCQTPISVSPSKPVSGSGDYTSGNYTTSSTGTYRWIAHYSGDTNNNAVNTSCNDANESSVANATNPTITTSLSSGTIDLGTSAYDTAVLSSATSNAGGTVTYTVYTDSSCTQNARSAGTKTVVSGSVPNSDSLSFTSAGDYYWQAVYSGDANNNGATSTCTDEHLVVNKAGTTLATNVENGQNQDITGASIPLGTPIHDTATLGGQVGDITPTGTLTYNFFTNGNCSGDASSSEQVAFDNASSTKNNLDAGDYSYLVSYSGDSNYFGSTAECESFTINKGSLSLETTIHNADGGAVVSGPVALGTSVYDSATVGGITGDIAPTNPVTFNFYASSDCTGNPTSAGSVALSGNTASPSKTQGPLAAGAYSFNASIVDDTNYTGGTSACEPLTVTPADTTVTTQVHDPSHNDITNSSVSLGTAVHDNATVNGQIGSFVPTGTVTYNLYGNNACSGDPIIAAEQVPVGTESTPQTLPAGEYGYKASYSGDSNYNGSTGTCEPFTVNKAQLSVTTTIHDADHNAVTSVDLGSVVHDTAAVNGAVDGFSVTNPVTFNFYSNNSCEGDGTAVSNIGADEVVTSSVRTSDSAPLGAGSYSYKANIAGDSNYLGGSSDCEPLTVNQGQATVTTEVHDSSENVIGAETLDFNVHDKATVTGSVDGFAPTGTVSFQFYSGTECDTENFTDAGTVSIANGIAHPSSTMTLPKAGLYSFLAHYNGDNNYPAMNGACEPFTLTTLQITKNTEGGDGTFNFNVDGPTQLTPTVTTTSGTGETSVIPVLSGNYSLNETVPTGWTLASSSCGIESSADDYTIDPGTAGTCTFNNEKDGTVKVVKYNDADKDGIFNNNEVTMNGWQMTLGDTTQTTENDGSTTFTNVVPDEYSLTETPQKGWEQTDIQCYNGEERVGYDEEGYFVEVSPGANITCYVGNHSLAPILTISKANNVGGSLHAGDNVQFTITVANAATAGASLNTEVTDLPAGGFTYQTGTGFYSINGGPQIAATFIHQYASPGVWNIGTLNPGDTAVLTYTANIAGNEVPGLYYDLAWAQGQDSASNTYYASAVNPGFVSDTFAGTQVPIVSDQQNGTGYNVITTGQVLGASTELPATGADTFWLYLAATLIVLGTGLGTAGWLIRRKYV